VRPFIRRQGRRKGQAYIEFIIVLPLFLVIIAGVIGFGQLLYTRLAVEAAAWAGTRHAVATLDEERGVSQAHLAVRYALDGFGLNPGSASVSVGYGGWGRGTDVATLVCYDVPSPPVPMGEIIAPQEICAWQIMPTERWQSRWE
jgi:Flp pilus assembly protein TadG